MANEFDDLDIRGGQNGAKVNDGKSFQDVIREKREQTEKILEDTKTNKQESLEERKKRLQAHRDVLLKMKKEQRNQELVDFKQKTTTKEDLHKELKDMDARIIPRSN